MQAFRLIKSWKEKGVIMYGDLSSNGEVMHIF